MLFSSAFLFSGIWNYVDFNFDFFWLAISILTKVFFFLQEVEKSCSYCYMASMNKIGGTEIDCESKEEERNNSACNQRQSKFGTANGRYCFCCACSTYFTLTPPPPLPMRPALWGGSLSTLRRLNHYQFVVSLKSNQSVVSLIKY